MTNYRSSKSYAAVAKDDNRKFALTDEYTDSMQTTLKDSIDAKEHLEYREHNEWLITVARLEYTGIFNGKSVDDIMQKALVMVTDIARIYDFIFDFSFGSMKRILRKRFVLPWNVMNFEASLASSHNLYQAIYHSVEMVHKASLRSAVHVRLEEQREAAVITQKYLERLHTAYIAGDALNNEEVITYDRHSRTYVKVATFNDSETVIKMYERVSEHFHSYVSNIDALLQMSNSSNEIVDENFIESYIRYASGFYEVSVEYLKDLRQYKTFVFEKSLQKVEKAESQFKEYGNDFFSILKRIVGGIDYVKMLEATLKQNKDNILRDGSESTLASFSNLLLDRNRSVSMVDFASMMDSKVLFRTMENTSGLINDAMLKLRMFARLQQELHGRTCAFMELVMSEPLLTELYKRLDTDYYYDYFSDDHQISYITMALRGEFYCDEWREPHIFGQVNNWLWLWGMSALQSKVTSLLEQSQLNGAFYRYYLYIICTAS